MIKSYQISDLFYGQTMANISELIHLNEPIWTNGKDYILLSCTHTHTQDFPIGSICIRPSEPAGVLSMQWVMDGRGFGLAWGNP